MPSTSKVDDVSTTSILYDGMAVNWELPDTLMQGTAGMRKAEETYLPRSEYEKPAQYKRRLRRSFLFGAFRSGVDGIVAKPFSKPITLSAEEDLPEKLQGISKQIDPEGRSLDDLAKDVYREAWILGLSHVLVDLPRADGQMTLAQERSNNIRPYWVRVSPKDLIRWTSEKGPDGKEMLTGIAIKETRVEKDPTTLYTEIEVEYIRILRAPSVDLEGVGVPGTWELWRKHEDDWVQIEEGTHSYPGIPLATYYTRQIGFLTAEPPLEDLAYLNLEHWQSSSDQSNILHVVRCPILFRTGLDASEVETEDGRVKVLVSPYQFTATQTSKTEADMKYVEHSGQAIGAGQTSIERLEQRMELLGLRPFLERSGNQLATSKAIDEARTDSDVRASARVFSDFLRLCYEISGRWIGQELPEDFKVELHTDFGVNLRGSEDIKTLLAMRVAGQLSPEAFANELRRRGFVGTHYDIEAEVRAMEDAATLRPIPDEDDDEDDEDGGNDDSDDEAA